MNSSAKSLVMAAIAFHLSPFAFHLGAMDTSLLMRTQTDPSRMMAVYGGKQWPFFTGFLSGGETAFTAVCWIRLHTNAGHVIVPGSQWSIESARATREGGAELPAIREVATAFSGSGGTFPNPNYDTHGCNGWEYGCYAVNIETDTPLTLVIAGTERQVAGSNGVMQAFNIKGSAADWSWSIAGGDGILFGFGVNPLVRFFGSTAVPLDMGMAEPFGGTPAVPAISNEWVMCALQARIETVHAIERMVAFTWYTESFPPGESTNTASRSTFAKDARASIFTCHMSGLNVARDTYGFKLFPRWLTDDQLRNVRDLDMFEMQRRGIARFAEVE